MQWWFATLVLTLASACGPRAAVPEPEDAEDDSVPDTEPSSGADAKSTGHADVVVDACGYIALRETGLMGRSPVVADINGDGLDDLLLDEGRAAVQAFLGDGSGRSFAPGPTFTFPERGRFDLGDFDGDGVPDIVRYDTDSDDIYTLLNGRDRELRKTTGITSLFSAFRVRDVDGDGVDDLTYGGFHSAPARTALGGDGFFTETFEFWVGACYVTAAAWADFDDDGMLDLAVVGSCNACLDRDLPITIYRRVAGGYEPVEPFAESSAAAAACDPPVLEPGDFNGDGRVDLVSQPASWAAAGFHLHMGLGDGTFEPPKIFDSLDDEVVRVVADVDLDGLTDIVLDNHRQAVLLRNDGVGFSRCDLDLATVALSHDFTGDARPELVGTDERGAWVVLTPM